MSSPCTEFKSPFNRIRCPRCSEIQEIQCGNEVGSRVKCTSCDFIWVTEVFDHETINGMFNVMYTCAGSHCGRKFMFEIHQIINHPRVDISCPRCGLDISIDLMPARNRILQFSFIIDLMRPARTAQQVALRTGEPVDENAPQQRRIQPDRQAKTKKRKIDNK